MPKKKSKKVKKNGKGVGGKADVHAHEEGKRNKSLLGHNAIFTPEVIDDIHIKSQLGRYRMRGMALMKKIPTFDDLVFADHANVVGGLQATLTLGRNTEISVVSMKNKDKEFGGLYGNASKGTYEVAVFRNNQMLPLSAFDDVLGWQTKNDISELMANFQGKSKDVDEFTCQLHNKAEELRQELLAD